MFLYDHNLNLKNYIIFAHAQGFFQGLTGIVEKPMEGLQREGGIGLMKGIGIGVTGVVLKPVVGVVDLVSKTTEVCCNYSHTHSLSTKQTHQNENRHALIYMREFKGKLNTHASPSSTVPISKFMLRNTHASPSSTVPISKFMLRNTHAQLYITPTETQCAHMPISTHTYPVIWRMRTHSHTRYVLTAVLC